MKKLCLIIISFTIFLPNIYAYDYINPDNEQKVMNDIDDIYNLKDLYIEFAGEDDDEVEIDYVTANNNKYWWPIGSVDTTTSNGKVFAIGDPESVNVTSEFAAREPGIHDKGHGGMDIGSGRKGETNVIAAKDGIVVYTSSESGISCPDGYLGSTCGGGYGNHIIISHSDGNYTLYAHLYIDSITVKSGESVEQGQVIAKMGTSGDSNGTHLHFEVRVGENTSSAKTNPRDYVDADNPRPTASNYLASGDLSSTIDFIRYWEGVGCGSSYQTDTEYIACNGGDGVITIGHGVTWENNRDAFLKYGITSLSPGSKVDKSIVDAIEVEAMDNVCGNSIRNALADAGIDDLKDYQMTVLISRCYNGGYGAINGGDYSFIPNYLKFRNSYSFEDSKVKGDNLWYNSMSHPFSPGSQFEVGLQRRRISEWKLFTTGEIDYFDSNFNPSLYVWDY